MRDNKKTLKIAGIIITGMAAAVLCVVAVLSGWYFKPEKLSKEKMQAAVEAASEQQDSEEETSADDESYYSTVKSFTVKAGQKGEKSSEKKETDNEYLCSYSSERLITKEEADELKNGTYEEFPEGKDIIQMVINEMYARHGYQFQSEELQAYFDGKKWYQDIEARIDNMDDIYSGMTEIEKKNIDFLSAYKEGE